MVAPFRCDDQVTIEHDVGVTEDSYGKIIPNWQPLFTRYWANLQDLLSSRAETTSNGKEQAIQRTRLRMRRNAGITKTMRVKLHSRGDSIMQIIAGPALLDDRLHEEWILEGYETHG